MKNLIAICIVTILVHLCIYQQNELSRKQHLVNLSKSESQLLRDWVEDYGNKIAELSSKTYEDGLKDGFDNYNNASYTRGYHAATMNSNPFTSIGQAE